MRYNFLTDSYEEEYSAFVTDFSKYEVIDAKEKEKPIKNYTNFEDDEKIVNEEKNVIEEEIKKAIDEKEVSGFVLEDFQPLEEIKHEEYVQENNWLLELEKLNNSENIEKISAQLQAIEKKLGRICDCLEKIFNV